MIGWLYADGLCRTLAKTVKEPEVVVGVLKGGMVPAVVVSHLLRKPLLALGVQSYSERRRGESVIYQTPPPNLLAGRKALLVDDICDTGETLRAAKELLEGLGANVETAVLQKKPHTAFTPDYWVEEVSGWVVYPWEIGGPPHV